MGSDLSKTVFGTSFESFQFLLSVGKAPTVLSKLLLEGQPS